MDLTKLPNKGHSLNKGQRRLFQSVGELTVCSAERVGIIIFRETTEYTHMYMVGLSLFFFWK